MRFINDRQRKAVFSKIALGNSLHHDCGRISNKFHKRPISDKEDVDAWISVMNDTQDKDINPDYLNYAGGSSGSKYRIKDVFNDMDSSAEKISAMRKIVGIDKLIDSGSITPAQTAILLKNREKLESGVEFSKTADLLKTNLDSPYVARGYVLEKLDLNGEIDKADKIRQLVPELEGTNALSREQVIKTLEMDDKPDTGLSLGKYAVDKSDFSKRPQSIGSSWEGDDYKHGPRIMQPSRFVFIRTVEPDDKYRKFVGGDKIPKRLPKGVKLIIGKLKGGNEWGVQSILTPKD